MINNIVSINKTKIAIVGCGAVGLNYGTRFLESIIYSNNQSIDLSFLVRRDYDLLKNNGILIKYGNKHNQKETRQRLKSFKKRISRHL